MKCYEIKTANTTYYARVFAGTKIGERDTVTLYGGRFGLIDTDMMPVRGIGIYGDSCGRRVRTSPVASVKRISRKRFFEVT